MEAGYKIPLQLIDLRWIEGTFHDQDVHGIEINDAHIAEAGSGDHQPLGERVFVPFSSILFIVTKE